VPNLAKRYQQEMHSKLSLFATWLPGDRIDLGDVGTFRDGKFIKQRSISDLSAQSADTISISEESAGNPQDLHFESTSGTKVSFSTGASAAGGRAEIKLEFSERGAFILQSAAVRRTRIGNRHELEAWVLARFDESKWNEDWYVIDEIYDSACTTVIVCLGDSASLTLTGKIPAITAGIIPLANPSVSLSVAAQSGQFVRILTKADARPLYACSKVNTRWFRDSTFEPQDFDFMKPSSGGPVRRENTLKPAKIDELLDS